MRRSLARRQGFQPELHRYSQSTFHEGGHRQAPGDSTPWRDASSPINRFKGWWLAPAAKGSVIAAWCITLVLGTYCYSIQYDAKGTYLLNTVLLRNLHEETQRADSNERRASELQEVVKQLATSSSSVKTKSISTSTAQLSDAAALRLELSREQTHADSVQKRNEELVRELAKVRQEVVRSEETNRSLRAEIDRLNRLSSRT